MDKKLPFAITTFIVSLLFLTCNTDSNKAKVFSEKLDSQYLERSVFAFEILSAKANVGKAVKANDKIILSYELEMVNAYRNSLYISKIEVINFDDKNVIASYDSSYLLEHFLRPGVRTFEDFLELKSSAFGVANLWLELDVEEIPEQIFHRISFKLKDRQGELQESTADVALIDYPEVTDLTIGLPFRSGKWFYIANAHRDVRWLTEGNPTFPQRYAIDWAALTNEVKFELDSSKNIEAFKTYNQDLLAVSDGIVVFVKDSVPENDPFGSKYAVQINKENVAGNYVVLDIGNEIYAFYGHLIPGSLSVKVGEHVKQGDMIGKLGNSGNSTGPHLHFHLESKSKYPLGGEGVPYVFENFTQLAYYKEDIIDSILSFTNVPLPLDQKMIKRHRQTPVGNGIVEF
ncbi:M23 family metallopeptidase [Saprospiraceae bacterium]|nr:M23 family metallopeptidase [Saprospiraceae bacterium]